MSKELDEPRRSARANKGVHSGRDLLDLYYQSAEDEHVSKKQKLTELEEDPAADFEVAEPKEIVRCIPCLTTDANYNEETDQGGLMIECEKCTTWQHAKCMGYRNETQIPEPYHCDVCLKKKVEPVAPRSSFFTELPPNTKIKAAPKLSAAAAKKAAILAANQRTRQSVSKALANVLVRTNSDLKDAQFWASKIESGIYEWAQCTDKKYIDKSRTVMALVKKPVVLDRFINSELSALDLATLPVEEIDPDLKEYADKVRQELIRRSVLVVEDDQSQRVRRTHKGEEIVESLADEGSEQNMNIAPRSITRENTNETQKLTRNQISTKLSTNKVYQLEDDDDYSTTNAQNETKELDGVLNKNLALNDIDSDDDIDLILNRKSKSPEPVVSTTKPERIANLPSISPTEFWTGEIQLPDVAKSAVKAEFISCTKYKEPRDTASVNFHNKALRICKELVEGPKLLIQGRLDRARADPYLEKIKSSRDLLLVKLVNYNGDSNFDSLYTYFLQRSKVGVISCRAACVKDAYMYAIEKNLPLLSDIDPEIGNGLYIIFVVKKDYTPVGKSILKKASPAKQSQQSAPSLHSILSQLEGPKSSGNPLSGHVNLPTKPDFVNGQPPRHHNLQPPPSHQMLNNLQQNSSSLTHEQLMYLTNLVNQNVQAQGNH